MNLMKQRGRIWRWLCLLPAVTMSSCTIIGLTIGLTSDAHLPKAMTIPGWKVDSLRADDKIEILFKDGTTLSCNHFVVEPLPLYQYARLHAEAQTRLPAEFSLPNLGDTLTMSFSSFIPQAPEMIVAGQLSEFDVDLIRFTANEHGAVTTKARRLSELLRLRDPKGRELSGEMIRDLIDQGKIPVRSGLTLVEQGGQRMVAANQIQQIRQSAPPRNGAFIGLVVGACLDAMVILAISSLSFGGI